MSNLLGAGRQRDCQNCMMGAPQAAPGVRHLMHHVRGEAVGEVRPGEEMVQGIEGVVFFIAEADGGAGNTVVGHTLPPREIVVAVAGQHRRAIRDVLHPVHVIVGVVDGQARRIDELRPVAATVVY